MNLGTLARLSRAQTRSISAETSTGRKGQGGMAPAGTGAGCARDLWVTTQALGWRAGGRYLPLQDDIASLAYGYQVLPAAPFPELPDRDYLEII
jgi:hypothetical protein